MAAEKTGVSQINIYNVWEVIDTIYVEVSQPNKDPVEIRLLFPVLFVYQDAHNLTWPDWARENYEKIDFLRNIGLYFKYKFPEMAKLLAGKQESTFFTKLTQWSRVLQRKKF